jgi:hypothetical protein
MPSPPVNIPEQGAVVAIGQPRSPHSSGWGRHHGECPRMLLGRRGTGRSTADTAARRAAAAAGGLLASLHPPAQGPRRSQCSRCEC